MTEPTAVQEQVDELLNLPQQIWLLGAGVSRGAGIPLMNELTTRVEAILDAEEQGEFTAIRATLPEDAHVEHVLSHISDLISLASRTASGHVNLDGREVDLDQLRNLHKAIQSAIRTTIRFGYIPADDESPEQIGTVEKPIVSIDGHIRFVDSLFRARRAGLERRPPVAFFTTNYDTLLEDALALGRIPTSDGFSGGTMAFWDPGAIFDTPFPEEARYQARVHKLHGSIDWFLSREDVVVRRREGAGYPPEASERLLIYPQSTKYQITQRDPFAGLFTAFRSALMGTESGLFAVCGYSFRDEHINEEIERAMSHRTSSLTFLAFVKQRDDEVGSATQGLPQIFSRWLSDHNAAWRQRIVVAGSRGFYHGGLENLLPASPDSAHGWWSFQGLTNFLAHGPETVV